MQLGLVRQVGIDLAIDLETIFLFDDIVEGHEVEVAARRGSGEACKTTSARTTRITRQAAREGKTSSRRQGCVDAGVTTTRPTAIWVFQIGLVSPIAILRREDRTMVPSTGDQDIGAVANPAIGEVEIIIAIGIGDMLVGCANFKP